MHINFDPHLRFESNFIVVCLCSAMLVMVCVVLASFFATKEGELHLPFHLTTQQIGVEYAYASIPLRLFA